MNSFDQNFQSQVTFNPLFFPLKDRNTSLSNYNKTCMMYQIKSFFSLPIFNPIFHLSLSFFHTIVHRNKIGDDLIYCINYYKFRKKFFFRKRWLKCHRQLKNFAEKIQLKLSTKVRPRFEKKQNKN